MCKRKRNIIKMFLAFTFILFIFVLVITWRNIYYIMNYYCEGEMPELIYESSGNASISYFKTTTIKYKNNKVKKTKEYEYDFACCIIRNS